MPRFVRVVSTGCSLGLSLMLASCASRPVTEVKQAGDRVMTLSKATLNAGLRDAMSVKLRVEDTGDDVTVIAKVKNETRTTLNGELAWYRNGSMQGDALVIEQLPGGATTEFRLPLNPHTGETTVLAIVSISTEQGRDRVRLFGQEMTSTPPRIDGVLDDWDDPATIRIWPSKDQTIPPREEVALSNEDFSGLVRVLWTEDTVYIGADIVDSTPRVNPRQGPYLWMGDSMEVYLGFPGPTTHKGLGRGYFQVGISPGNGGKNPSAWNYTNGRTVADAKIGSAPTENGYSLEAAIPLSEFDAEVEAGDLLAFTVHLNDKISSNGDGVDRVLIWAGDDTNWEDPSVWGAAMILPDPANEPPSPKRVQLFGGETKFDSSTNATKEESFLTPLPTEYPEKAAHLPDWLTLSLPFRGSYKITGGYGFENDGWTHQTITNPSSANDFYAIDIGTPTGTPVLVAADGHIVTSGRRGDSYGNYIVVDHGRGYHTIYAHLDKLEYEVDKGEPEIELKRGDLLGYSGSTGTRWPHLHFAVHKDTRISHSGADVGGIAIVPEPLGGFYGLRQGHLLVSE